jgi:hypothetical protein
MQVHVAYQIPMQKTLIAVSFLNRAYKLLRGRRTTADGCISSEWGWGATWPEYKPQKRGKGNCPMVLGRRLPSPTMLRAVSGRKKIIRNRQKPEAILRNQKIHRQPAFAAIIPPSKGPMLGAVLVLQQVSYEPIQALKSWQTQGQQHQHKILSRPDSQCQQ